MDFTSLLLLVFLYVVLSLIRGAGKKRPDAPAGGGELEDEAGPALEPPATRGGRPLPRPRGEASRDLKAARLEQFLRDFERRVADAAGLPSARGPLGRRAAEPLAGSEEVETVESLEVEPEVLSLEIDPGPRGRDDVALDEVSAAAAERRRRLADHESRPLTVEGHRVFDQRIRAESPAAASEDVNAAWLRRLRQAIIVNEILGRPKSLQ